MISRVWSLFLWFGLNFYALVMVCKDYFGFLHVDFLIFASSSEFQSIGYDLYGVALVFYIWALDFVGLVWILRGWPFDLLISSD